MGVFTWNPLHLSVLSLHVCLPFGRTLGGADLGSVCSRGSAQMSTVQDGRDAALYSSSPAQQGTKNEGSSQDHSVFTPVLEIKGEKGTGYPLK